MQAACLRQTQLPHTSRLFEDFTYHFDRVARFYGHHPHDGAGLRQAAAELDYPAERRAALVEALRHQNPDSPALRELAKPGTVAVVTGQQVGLFSGPAYTIYKALTAVRMARRLTEEGIRAVPVFWLATEDHDFAEVDHAWVFGGNHQPRMVRARPAGEVTQQPVGGIPLAGIPLEELRRTLAELPFGSEVAAEVERAYRPGRTMGESFRELVRSLLAKYDLLYVDPLDEPIRRLGAPLLREAVLYAGELKARLRDRDAELQSAGYHSQVHLEPQTSLVFLLDGVRRITLKVQNGHYLAKDVRYSADELAGRAEHLSPNALLRPVMQDYILPTVAYVGGPAELAYFAQAQALYRQLLGRMPVVLHRAAFTLLDQRAEKLLRRYEVGWPEIFEGEERIREHIAARLVPPAVRTAAENASAEIERALERYRLSLEAFDPTLAAALESSRRKIHYQLSKIGRKTAREAMRRDQRAQENAAFLAGLLYPNKHLQERLYSILPFLAKHGLDLIDHIFEHVRLDCPDHQVLVV
jgi:bacillithiol biosynthesis cysteine-adding enzyme BshC